MLVLLPPSEGKTAPPADANPVDLAALVHADTLTATRERILAALIRLSAGPRRKALDALGLSEGLAPELARNAGLRDAPAAPAAEVYTGVLYQHLDLASLTPRARERARERVLVASALWGVVRLEDRIPAYRLSIGARIPALRRTLASMWKPVLADALPAEGLVVDLRSGGYAAMWTPPPAATVVAVRALTESRGPGGRPVRKPISHMAKATRGDVARLVAQARSDPRDPAALAALVERSGRRVELDEPARGGAPWTLDVIQEG